jgi:hypothetical protein
VQDVHISVGLAGPMPIGLEAAVGKYGSRCLFASCVFRAILYVVAASSPAAPVRPSSI